MDHSVQSIFKSDDDDTRIFRRHNIQLTILVRAIPCIVPGVTIPSRTKASHRAAVTENISMSGLSFLSAETYPVRSEVEIQMQLGARMYQCRARVRRSYVKMLPGRRAFGCGVQFLQGDDAKETLLALANYLKNCQLTKAR